MWNRYDPRLYIERFGQIDYLINNAGFGMNGAFEEISDEELRTLFETDWLKENNHKQMGDPEKAAGFLYKTAEKQKLPQILTIGKDCSDASLKHYKKIIEDMESYYDDSCKTSFED